MKPLGFLAGLFLFFCVIFLIWFVEKAGWASIPFLFLLILLIWKPLTDSEFH